MSQFNCPECKDEFVHLQQPFTEGIIEAGGADYKIIIPFFCENMKVKQPLHILYQKKLTTDWQLISNLTIFLTQHNRR